MLLVACGGPEPTTPAPDPEPQVQCADTVYFDLTLTGDVQDGDGVAAGADVRIEERNYEPSTTVHGTAVTDPQGRFSVDATALPIVEGCWGWATGFYVVAEQDGRTAEWGINSVITGAWQDGDTTADLSGIPLDLAD